MLVSAAPLQAAGTVANKPSNRIRENLRISSSDIKVDAISLLNYADCTPRQVGENSTEFAPQTTGNINRFFSVHTAFEAFRDLESQALGE